MKNYWRIIIFFILSIWFLSLHSIALACSANDCSGWESFTGCTSDSYVNYNNDFLNPTASYNITCCNWQNEYSNPVLGLGDVRDVTPGGRFWGGCDDYDSYIGMFALVANTDYTSNTPNMNGHYPAISNGVTVVQNACSNLAIYAADTTQYEFYYTVCNSATEPLPTPSKPCIGTGDPRLLCTLPIACTFLTGDDRVLHSYCYFVKFPPSPPAFCCSIAPPVQIPTTAAICTADTLPAATNQCVLPSPDAGTARLLSVNNNFFTPAIRVAFNTNYASQQSSGNPSNLFVPFKNPVVCHGNVCTTPPLTTTSTIEQCNAVNVNCVSGITASNYNIAAGLPKNLELIYNNPSGQPTRYYTGSLFGVNLGQYCDLSYDLAHLQLKVQSQCTILDMYGNSLNFHAALDPVGCDDKDLKTCTSICVNNGQTMARVGACMPIPPFPLPSSVAPCSSSNTSTKFCIQANFTDGFTTDNITGQISGVPMSPPESFAGTITYPGSISGNAQNLLTGIVTDDGYNLPLNATGDICFDDSTSSPGGQPVTPCPPAPNAPLPKGLYYNNGQYMSGGRQFCYLPSSSQNACDPTCTTNCNCVLANTITMSIQGKERTIVSTAVSDRVIPLPSVTMPFGSSNTYNGTNPAPRKDQNQGVRGFTPLEMGLCVPLTTPIPFISCDQLNSLVYPSSSSGFCLNASHWNYVNKLQTTAYHQMCIDYQTYCADPANNSQCNQHYQQCVTSNGDTPPKPPTGITSPSPLYPLSVTDPTMLNICGFFKRSSECTGHCGMFTYCCDSGVRGDSVQCQFAATCENETQQACRDNIPPP